MWVSQWDQTWCPEVEDEAASDVHGTCCRRRQRSAPDRGRTRRSTRCRGSTIPCPSFEAWKMKNFSPLGCKLKITCLMFEINDITFCISYSPWNAIPHLQKKKHCWNLQLFNVCDLKRPQMLTCSLKVAAFMDPYLNDKLYWFDNVLVFMKMEKTLVIVNFSMEIVIGWKTTHFIYERALTWRRKNFAAKDMAKRDCCSRKDFRPRMRTRRRPRNCRRTRSRFRSRHRSSKINFQLFAEDSIS